MAVIAKYVVVRNGVEKMTFATKKEADLYDKMLDIADDLYEFLEKKDLGLDEEKMEAVSLTFARDRDEIITILRGVKQKKSSSVSKPAKPVKSKTDSKEPEAEIIPISSKDSTKKTPLKNKKASSKKVS